MRPINSLPLLLSLGTALSPVGLAATVPDQRFPTESATARGSVAWTAALRFRSEQVEQAGFARSAQGSTARLRLGMKYPLAHAVQAFVEGEAVWAMNGRFNSGANGRTHYPSIADAPAAEINQAGLSWQGERNGATVGRQRIAFDNQRFIGNSGWRQNEQTFDAILLSAKPVAGWTLHYGYLDRVHRVAGDRVRDPLARERNLAAHLWHATADTLTGPLTGYAYAIEDEDAATASSRTLGLRWASTGTHGDWRWSVTLEAARQYDHAGNPLRFAHGYRFAELGAVRGPVTAKLGWERLEGDGQHALQTPFATLHAFNGWADVFLTTPPNGLDDRYASIAGTWPWAGSSPLEWSVAAHDYRPNRSGDRYGREWNASLGTKFARGWSALFKFADYRSDRFARDTRKIWVQVEWVR